MLLVAPVLVSAFAFGGRVLAPSPPTRRSLARFRPCSRAVPSMGFANKLNTMNKIHGEP